MAVLVGFGALYGRTPGVWWIRVMRMSPCAVADIGEAVEGDSSRTTRSFEQMEAWQWFDGLTKMVLLSVRFGHRQDGERTEEVRV